MSRDKRTKVLLTGASGFVGFNLMRFLGDDFELHGSYSANRPPTEAPRLVELDITSPGSVREVFEEIEPEVIIHAAAKADVDFCQKNQDISHKVNVTGTENLAKQAKLTAARFVYLSTDLVFDGEKGSYTEEQTPNPTTFYASTKLEAENRVSDILETPAVIRLALMYGNRGYSSVGFAYRMIKSLKAGKPFRLFTDQHRTPLFLEDLGEALNKIIRDQDFQGLYHLGGPQRVSRLNFGKVLAEVFGFSQELLLPAEMEDLPEMAPRPRDCSLNSSKIVEKLNLRPKTVREGLERLERDMSAGDQRAGISQK